jgi:hypothetical protein
MHWHGIENRDIFSVTRNNLFLQIRQKALRLNKRRFTKGIMISVKRLAASDVRKVRAKGFWVFCVLNDAWFLVVNVGAHNVPSQTANDKCFLLVIFSLSDHPSYDGGWRYRRLMASSDIGLVDAKLAVKEVNELVSKVQILGQRYFSGVIPEEGRPTMGIDRALITREWRTSRHFREGSR